MPPRITARVFWKHCRKLTTEAVQRRSYTGNSPYCVIAWVRSFLRMETFILIKTMVSILGFSLSSARYLCTLTISLCKVFVLFIMIRNIRNRSRSAFQPHKHMPSFSKIMAEPILVCIHQDALITLDALTV